MEAIHASMNTSSTTRAKKSTAEGNATEGKSAATKKVAAKKTPAKKSEVVKSAGAKAAMPKTPAPKAATAQASAKKPAAKKAAAKLVVAKPTAIELAQFAAHAASEKKGDHIRLIDLREASAYTDFFLIVSGTSDRHVLALADAVTGGLRMKGFRPTAAEGLEDGAWVLLDYGDFVVHIFQPEVREFYDLDGLWADAPRLPVAA